MNTKLFRTTVIASVVALLASAAMVQAADTNTLLELKGRCISATATNQATCSSYIEGVVRGYLATVATLEKHNMHLAFFCGPTSEAPDIQGSGAYVRKYINSHPDDDQRDAESVIFEALREAYGCKD
jgi:hypothetical protein